MRLLLGQATTGEAPIQGHNNYNYGESMAECRELKIRDGRGYGWRKINGYEPVWICIH